MRATDPGADPGVDPSATLGDGAPSRSRIRVLAVVTVVCVLCVAAGAMAATVMQSPAEVAASSAQPEPSRVTAEVVLQELTASVAVRGDVGFADTVTVSSYALDDEVVTDVPHEPGTQLSEGDRVIEVAERPVIVLEGRLPMYRDLGPGATGTDVEQLNQALDRLGLLEDPVDDVYGPATETAVAELFESQGYAAPEPDAERADGLAIAEEEVRQARRAVQDAKRAAERSGPRESEIQDAEAQLERAKDDAEVARVSAELSQADAERAVDRAIDEEQSAADALEDARSRLDQAVDDDEHPDTGQPPTDEEIEALEAEVADAETALEQAGEDRAAREGELKRVRLESGTQADAAARAVDIARTRLGEAREGSGDEQVSVERAEEDLERAEGNLAEIEAEVGVVARRSEIVFVPSAPVTIADVIVGFGAPAQGDLVELSAESLVVEAAVRAGDRRLAEVGQPARIEATELGIVVDGVVSELADQPGGGELSGDEYRMVVELDEGAGAEAERLHGLNVAATLPVASTDGEVLSVPLTAVFSEADGTVRVEVEDDPDEPTRLVKVEPGLSTDGHIEVAPVDGSLEPGDRVVVERPPYDAEGDQSDDD